MTFYLSSSSKACEPQVLLPSLFSSLLPLQCASSSSFLAIFTSTAAAAPFNRRRCSGDSRLSFSRSFTAALSFSISFTAALSAATPPLLPSTASAVAACFIVCLRLVCDGVTFEYGQVVDTAVRMLKEGGMDAIKLEGGYPSRITAAKFIVEAGIAVMGHVGLTPQAISVLGGFRPQGKSVASAVKVVETAMALQEALYFSVVLECVPAPVAAAATSALQIPTIGIGAGPFCSGQTRVMVGSPRSPLCCCRTSCEDSSSYNSVQVLGEGK